MKSIKTLCFTLGAILAFGALSASAATAYEWQINGTAVTKATAAHWTSTIKFENTYDGGYAFTCTIVHKGTIDTGGKVEITSIASSGGAKLIPCEVTRASAGLCKSAIEVEAVGLPWTTELATVGGVLRSQTAGSREWKIKCKGPAGETNTDWCGVTSTGPHNVAGGVEEIYDSNSPHTACFDEGGLSFVASGAELLAPESGGTLSIAPAPAEWQLGGKGLSEPLTDSWKGKIKLTDPKALEEAPETVECEDTATGLAGLANTGEVTEWTYSNCTGTVLKETCQSPVSIQAVNLPWHSELVTVGGVTHDIMTSGGSGTPGYKMRCTEKIGGKVLDECTGTPTLTTTDGEKGVSAAFTSEKLNCTKGGTGAGTLEGTQTLSVTSGKLEVR